MISDAEVLQTRLTIYLALIAKSGVREWEEPPEIRAAIWTAAIDAAWRVNVKSAEADDLLSLLKISRCESYSCLDAAVTLLTESAKAQAPAQIQKAELRIERRRLDLAEQLSKPMSLDNKERLLAELIDAKRSADEEKSLLERVKNQRAAETATEKAKEAARRVKEEQERKKQEYVEALNDRAVLCADGTVSSCLCNGPRRGCCSRHGGVAGCEPMPK
jgi:hypothetical protein